MANQGLLNWAKDNHISAEITSVGDSNVVKAMIVHSIEIGGEQSGHIILPGEPTGDGMLTALMITKIIAETNTTLHELANIFTKSPQVIVNFSANPEQKQTFKSNDQVKKLLLEYNKKLEPINGRLLVRPSGTEPLIRITMWGDDESIITDLANGLKNKLIEILRSNEGDCGARQRENQRARPVATGASDATPNRTQYLNQKGLYENIKTN